MAEFLETTQPEAKRTNFSNYIDRGKFQAPSFSRDAPTFGFQSFKPFHLESRHVKELDHIYGHSNPFPITQSREIAYPTNLGRPAPLSHHNLAEPFSFVTDAFPQVGQWKPAYLEGAYSHKLVGKTKREIEQKVAISHARDPANGGEPRSQEVAEPAEWAKALLAEIGVDADDKEHHDEKVVENIKAGEQNRKTQRKRIHDANKSREKITTSKGKVQVMPVTNVIVPVKPVESEKKSEDAEEMTPPFEDADDEDDEDDNEKDTSDISKSPKPPSLEGAWKAMDKLNKKIESLEKNVSTATSTGQSNLYIKKIEKERANLKQAAEKYTDLKITRDEMINNTVTDQDLRKLLSDIDDYAETEIEVTAEFKRKINTELKKHGLPPVPNKLTNPFRLQSTATTIIMGKYKHKGTKEDDDIPEEIEDPKQPQGKRLKEVYGKLQKG